MKGISISTCFDYSIPIEDQLGMISDAGFSHVSLGGNFAHSGILEQGSFEKVKTAIDISGLLVDTLHGQNMDSDSAFEINKKVALAASRLSAPVVVLHCSSFAFNPDSLEYRKKDIVAKLPQYAEIAETCGIRFAFENLMPGAPTELCEYVLQTSDPKYFGFCYDSSHDQIDGPNPMDLLKRNIGRLSAVHISDRIREFVDHVIPGEGFIDLREIGEIISSAYVDFPLLFEVMTTHSQYKEPHEFLSAAYSEALKLSSIINKTA